MGKLKPAHVPTFREYERGGKNPYDPDSSVHMTDPYKKYNYEERHSYKLHPEIELGDTLKDMYPG